MSERRVLVIGGTGTIGSAVVRELSTDHHVEVAGRSSDPAVDLSDSTSIDRLADRLADGPIHEAVVVCAGGGMPGMVEDLDPSAALEALRPKLFGQIAVARAAPRFVRPGGAVVLTSGILERRPMPGMRLRGRGITKTSEILVGERDMQARVEESQEVDGTDRLAGRQRRAAGRCRTQNHKTHTHTLPTKRPTQRDTKSNEAN